jgi:hypothetical protein
MMSWNTAKPALDDAPSCCTGDFTRSILTVSETLYHVLMHVYSSQQEFSTAIPAEDRHHLRTPPATTYISSVSHLKQTTILALYPMQLLRTPLRYSHTAIIIVSLSYVAPFALLVLSANAVNNDLARTPQMEWL